jgi:hypothetical protein
MLRLNDMERTKEDIVRDLNLVASSIKKHRSLAMWGNVESKMRIAELRQRKRELQNELITLNK